MAHNNRTRHCRHSALLFHIFHERPVELCWKLEYPLFFLLILVSYSARLAEVHFQRRRRFKKDASNKREASSGSHPS